jgi:hypothetical protein
MRVQFSVCAAAASMLAFGVATTNAAVISEATGPVLVNTGTGFKPASVGQVVPDGSRVMVTGQGVAKITYESLCTVVVRNANFKEPGFRTTHRVGDQTACLVAGPESIVPPGPGGIAAAALVVGGGVGIYAATKRPASR